MDPGVCLVHPSKRQPVGVCHLCLRDRLVRLSLSGDSSSSHTLLPNSSSSRSSFDSSSCSKTDDSNGNGKCGSGSVVGKLGTIFSLMESDSEEAVARIEEKEGDVGEEDDEEVEQSVPSCLPRSKSLSQWQQQHPPRRSSSTKDPAFARFAAPDSRNGGEGGFPADGFSSARNSKNAAGSYHSPLVSASATPVAHHVDRDHRGARNPHHHSGGGGKLSWISSLFGLRKRKKKSSHNGAVETNFFPPEAWNDDFHHRGAHADRDRLWRSRSVSSGRVIKKSFTPLGDPPLDHPGAPTGIDPATSSLEPPRASAQGIEPRVASLIALDMTKVITNAAYDVEDSGDGGAAYVAGPRSSVASLMDIDRKCAAATCASPTVLQRSRSTGGWRRMIRSESPSSVLANPTAHGSGNGNSDWGFYLTPLRTFNKSRGGSKQGR
ncbi:hypothetical protein SELMODRAFT_414666 [Selaginella moellendorffii]|uniref:Uncharacterized protein n=1 Tax=Selaginella moellendorffii TaxID=88036 RepID=D8RTI9_SELML|nr:uncharacterized protein LOC9658403 [Selaginella moellendorffii]EFJ24683.1 hypothetical protein SELMODRAFT_414666 [Selaginella moellendorffii]|eukprot:XP_002974461.1 uncharacterized protein LOC9658403 [Selaginella moellendorffii]